MDKPPNIDIRNAHLAYEGNVLFDNLNITIKAGKLTCLLGPSGVGKTTILRMIANLITLGGNSKEILRGEITSDSTTPIHEQIAYLAQEDSLLPWLSAIENALLGARLRGTVTDELKQRAQTLFMQMSLTKAQHQLPQQLSGGMRQRVALIRTLLEDKPIVLMDEPFSALDAITRYQLQSIAVDILKDRTVLLITHDPMEALRMADHIYILSGRPANIHFAIECKTPAPRSPDNIELMQYQAQLFHELTKAKERDA